MAQTSQVSKFFLSSVYIYIASIFQTGLIKSMCRIYYISTLQG